MAVVVKDVNQCWSWGMSGINQECAAEAVHGVPLPHHSPLTSPPGSPSDTSVLCARRSPYTLHHASQKFSQPCLWNSSYVRLTDDGPLSSFRGRLSSASSFHASLLQEIVGVVSLALRPLVLVVVSLAPQHFRSSKKQATCKDCFARQCICLVISLHSRMFKPCLWYTLLFTLPS